MENASPQGADAPAPHLLDPSQAPMTMRELLEAGVHFGHQTKRWNPKMRPYIYGARNGVHIIDLQQTLPMFIAAYRKVVEVAANGQPVLFVGTKKQAQDAIREEASRSGMYYVTNRWLGGTLTNFRTVRASIEKLKTIRSMLETESDSLLKKEQLQMERQAEKLERNLGGIKDMNGLPGVVIVVDPRKERIAVAEAIKLKIPVIAITDTNCDPDVVDYVIPGNDDAIRAIRLFAVRLSDACMVGKRLGRERAVVDKDQQPAVATTSSTPQEPIRVASGGDGPKVEVVSRRGTTRTEPEAAAAPESDN